MATPSTSTAASPPRSEGAARREVRPPLRQVDNLNPIDAIAAVRPAALAQSQPSPRQHGAASRSIDNYYASHGRPNNPFEHPEIDAIVDEYKQTIDPDERDRLAGEIFEKAFELYANVPLASLSAEVIVNPETIAGWTFPGVTSGGTSHFKLIEPAT